MSALNILSQAMSRRVIAVCGLKRCGKDTLADYIVERYGFDKVKIADPLKLMCKHLFSLSNEQVEGHEKETVDARWGVAPRQIMQFMGTEVFQYKLQELMPTVGRTFWIKQLLEAHPTGNLVISDMRFAHEYEYLKAHEPNLIVIKIVRDQLTKDAFAEHCSEKEWERIPESFMLRNNTSVEQMFRDFEAIYHLD